MITLKTDNELAIMDRCNVIVLDVLSELSGMIRPGLDIADLDAYAEERTRQEGALPSFKGYHGFPSTLCVSLNEQVVHGIPKARKLVQGDIVSIDFGVFLEQFHGDGAETRKRDDFGQGPAQRGAHYLFGRKRQPVQQVDRQHDRQDGDKAGD